MTDSPCICARLRKATRSLTKRYDAALEPAGITVVQFSQLRTIERLDQPTIGTLASAMALDRSATGRNLRVLARMGHVTLGPGLDERTREIGLTPSGQAVIARAAGLWESVQDEITDRLGADRHALLMGLLEELGGPSQHAPNKEA